jgi:hypothetical protein
VQHLRPARRRKGENRMKPFLMAIAVMIAISVGASIILNAGFQKRADQAFATTGARVDAAH